MEPIVLFVHAHPDDESIATGGTIAHAVRAGARVVLVTATRGEGGEVIGDDLAHLEGDRHALAGHREQELSAAMQALGVADHWFLGNTGAEAAHGFPARRFEDSGMVWGDDGHAHAPASMPTESLCAAPLDDVSGRLAAVIAEVDPHLVITYAADGGYGHPDHRLCHDATVRALRAGGPERSERTRLLTIVNPAAAVEQTFDATAPGFDLTGFTAAEAPATIADDAPIAVAQDVEDDLGAKSLAMAAHATQVVVAGQFFALSNSIGQRIGTVEHYALADFARAPDAPVRSLPDGTVDDILLLAPVRSAGEEPSGGTGIGHRDPDAVSQHGLHVPVPGGIASQTAQHQDTGASAVAASAAPDATRPRAERSEASWPATLGGCVHALVIGVVVGLIGSLQHLNASVMSVAGSLVIVPWGLVLALVLTAVALWHISVTYRSTIVTVVLAMAVSGLSFALAQPGLWPGNDLVVTGSLRSLVWLFAPMILAAIIVFIVPARKRQSRLRV